MIVTCDVCLRGFDDEFRLTYCPHDTFSANDDQNNFAHHPESYLGNNAVMLFEEHRRADGCQTCLDADRVANPGARCPEGQRLAKDALASLFRKR